MLREMNKKIFLQNLQNTVEEINLQKEIKPVKYKFKINPVIEKGKSMQAKDEMMRLNVLNPSKIEGKFFTMDEDVSILTFFNPFVPIWIDVKLIRFIGEEATFQLNCSLRLRKPSLLRNQKSGHPPFRTII